MRKINEIAKEIRSSWKHVSPYAEPYLQAMEEINNITDNYFYDSAESIVLYFLSNAAGFRGNDARRIKKELKDMCATLK